MVADLDPDERRGNPTGTAGRRVLLLVNPRSRRGDSPLNGVIDVLQQAGMAVLRESVEHDDGTHDTIVRDRRTRRHGMPASERGREAP